MGDRRANAVQWYTSDTTLYSQPLAKTDSEFLDSDSDYDEFDPKRLEDMPGGTFISDTSDFYRETRNVRPPPSPPRPGFSPCRPPTDHICTLLC